MTKELRSCPFCGGEAHLHIHERYGVECDECGMGLGCICDTEEEAIKRWNRRERIDKVVEQLEECRDYHKKCAVDNNFRIGIVNGFNNAIEIVKGGAE